MTADQVVATAVFVGIFVLIMTEKVHRTWAAVGGAVLVSAFILQSPSKIWDTIDWETIIFIFGMMVMVEGMSRSGFFRWLCLYVARILKYNVPHLFAAFMLVSAFLSMFIGSITVMLFLAGIIIELSRLLKFNPVPFIIATVFAANVGGSATLSGDPPNIIIGTAHGFDLSFFDFLTNIGIVAWIGVLVSLAFFYFVYRRKLRSESAEPVDAGKMPQPAEAITDRPMFKFSIFIFLFVVVLLMTHRVTGLTLDWIGVIAMLATLAAVLAVRLGSGHSSPGAALKADGDMLKGVDWLTLIFLLGLFVTVGGMEESGMMDKIAGWIGDAAGGELVLAITIILWISAFASALIDNIPFALAMVPVVESLSATHGWSKATLSWPLALGTDIGGNATPIGASANVVATAIADREGHHISWGTYCKYALPAMILVIGICNVYLILRYV